MSRAEFTVEPFVDGVPGPHVTAALDAVRKLGFEPEIGPFATTVTGEADQVLQAITALLEAAHAAGASRVSVRLDFGD